MAQETIIIAEISSKNGWINIKTNDGKEVSVKEDKALKTAAALKDAKPGSEVTGNLVGKDGKFYLWDLDEKKGGGNKSFTPKDKSFDAAICAAESASNMLSLSKDPSIENFDKLFEHIHKQIMSKATAPAATTEAAK